MRYPTAMTIRRPSAPVGTAWTLPRARLSSTPAAGTSGALGEMVLAGMYRYFSGWYQVRRLPAGEGVELWRGAVGSMATREAPLVDASHGQVWPLSGADPYVPPTVYALVDREGAATHADAWWQTISGRARAAWVGRNGGPIVGRQRLARLSLRRRGEVDDLITMWVTVLGAVKGGFILPAGSSVSPVGISDAAFRMAFIGRAVGGPVPFVERDDTLWGQSLHLLDLHARVYTAIADEEARCRIEETDAVAPPPVLDMSGQPLRSASLICPPQVDVTPGLNVEVEGVRYTVINVDLGERVYGGREKRVAVEQRVPVQ